MHIKYPKIKILGDESNKGILTTPGKIIVQEKVDGGNFGFYIKNDVLYFCSRNQNLTDSDQIAKTGLPKTWKGIKPVLDSFKKDPLMFDSDLYYYGESLQRHTISYDDIPGFIGFDIFQIDLGSDIYRDIPTGHFFNWKWSKKCFEKMELPFIHTYHEISTEEEITIEYLKSLYQKSAYRNGKAEGIVIKRYDTQQMAKIVDDAFKEKNHKIFGKPQQKQVIEDKIVNIYITDARIEKTIYKLHDEGHKIEMPMMQVLYKFVIQDMLEEEILELYETYNSIDFKNLNRLVSKKCVIVLKKVIMNE